MASMDTENRADARIEKVEQVGAFRQLAPGFYNRPVTGPGDLQASSPFVLLVEDRIGALDDDHMHPHRGFETVTFVIEGEITNVDHTGFHSVAGAGTVQWMTAGSGIFHGGHPPKGATCHMLQLWLNLPDALRNSPPESREQLRADAVEQVAPGVRVTTYGEGSRQPGQAAWSRHPITLTDVELNAGADHVLVIARGERIFLYLLSGSVELGGRTLTAGDVAWIAVDDRAQKLAVRAIDAARLVACSGQPIDEPSVVRGPFVMTDEADIRWAYADLAAGRLIA